MVILMGRCLEKEGNYSEPMVRIKYSGDPHVITNISYYRGTFSSSTIKCPYF